MSGGRDPPSLAHRRRALRRHLRHRDTARGLRRVPARPRRRLWVEPGRRLGGALGALADRHGPRVMLVVTVGMAGGAFALVATVHALWQLYLFVGVLGGVGMAGFYLLSTATVARWFDDGRGLALALVLVGFNLGYITAGPLAAWLIETLGWRRAYALIGSGSGALMVLAALTVRLPRAG